jgi:predicted dehydrogenase/nucleoside-diphosphate-sugar epimerase
MDKTSKIAIIGAGFIADYHIKALKRLRKVEIAAICDTNESRAKTLEKKYQIPKIYTQLMEMLNQENLDAVHILVPPHAHFPLAKEILSRGIHVFLEKPMCTSSKECEELISIAKKADAKIGINHNFLFYPIYECLKKDLKSYKLGPIDQITINWFRDFEAVRSGSVTPWLDNNPENVFIEIGSHLTALALDLFGELPRFTVETGSPIELNNGTQLMRRWIVLSQSEKSAIEMKMSLLPGYDDFTIQVRGAFGNALANFSRNFYCLLRHTKFRFDLDHFFSTISESRALAWQAYKNLFTYIFSKLRIIKKATPYQDSFNRSIECFYSNLHKEIDPRLDPEFGMRVVKTCSEIAAKKSHGLKAANNLPIHPANKKPEILIFGSTGFIGKSLLEHFLKHEQTVRVVVRNKNKLGRLLHYPKLEVIEGDLHDPQIISQSVKGIKHVYHLSLVRGGNYDEYLQNDVKITKNIADACLNAKVQSFIYTSTIDLYFAGDKSEIITENTPIDPKIHQRNPYAQAKAASEHLLNQYYQNKGLPLILFRPGIVIGQGGTPFHWGVGCWQHEGSVCQLWGEGKNPLPFVLVDDVVQSLAACKDIKGIYGQSFNLIDNPCLTANEYLDEFQKALKGQIQIYPTPIWKFFIKDAYVSMIKYLTSYPGAKPPSYRDWQSRTQLAQFDCSKAKKILGWKPASDRAKLISKGIHLPAKEWFR